MIKGLATVAVITTTLLTGCGSIRVVSDYDEVVDKGISEFSEQLNTHIKNMAELGGEQEGTYDATFKTYKEILKKTSLCW